MSGTMSDKYTLEQSFVEVATGKTFTIMGTPMNCKIYSSKNGAYILAHRSGNLIIIDKEDLERGKDFVLRKEDS